MKGLLSGVFALAAVAMMAAPPVFAKDEVDTMSEIVGEAIGHMARLTGELRACRDEYPDEAARYTEALARYRETLAGDVAVLQEAMRRIGSVAFFETLWGAALAIGYSEAAKANEKAKQDNRSPLAKCQKLLAAGATTDAGAGELQPMGVVMPQKWQVLSAYARRRE